MINAETVERLRERVAEVRSHEHRWTHGITLDCTDAEQLADALETLARAYLADAGEDAPEADLARAILGETNEQRATLETSCAH